MGDTYERPDTYVTHVTIIGVALQNLWALYLKSVQNIILIEYMLNAVVMRIELCCGAVYANLGQCSLCDEAFGKDFIHKSE